MVFQNNCVKMNLTKCVCRAFFVETLILKQYNFLATFKIAAKLNGTSAKKMYLNYYSTVSSNGSLTKEPASFIKKRLPKKKKLQAYEDKGFRVTAFSTAEEYNLEKVLIDLPRVTAFKPSKFNYEFINLIDAVHAEKNSSTEALGQDLFFFRDGCIVIWNLPDSDIKKILDFLKPYEGNSFKDELIKNESEVLTYSVSDSISKTQIHKDSLILFTGGDLLLEKYAVSNAMALSVLLGTHEANLEQYIDTMEPVTEDLKAGNKIKMTRNEALQKMGQLFAIRHNINLNSDLLDSPDFYWDRDELEIVYQSVFNFYCINKRTKVINEKINHCIELAELLSSHLNDKHHVRLEWMIIILIMVEVGFEICHYLERYMRTEEAVISH